MKANREGRRRPVPVVIEEPICDPIACLFVDRKVPQPLLKLFFIKLMPYFF